MTRMLFPSLRPGPLLIIFSCFISFSFNARADDKVLENLTTREGENGTPAILDYVQQQAIQSPRAQSETKSASSGLTKSQREKMSAQRVHLAKQEKIIRQLRAQIEQLKKQMQADTLAPNNEKSLRASIEKMQDKIAALTAEKNRLSELTLQLADQKNNTEGDTQAPQGKAKELARLKELLKKTQKVSAEQQAQMAAMASSLIRATNQSKTLQQELLTADKAKLQAKPGEKAIKPALKEPQQQQAYSIGVSLGQVILDELATYEAQGAKMDRATVIRGVEDLLAGHPELDEETRKKALRSASNALYERLNAIEMKAIKEGKAYQQKFAKQKGVQFRDGIYSRIDYRGQEPIKPDDIVTVVVKETLPDGTVISDMEALGKVWSQPVSAYPSIFKGPLLRLGNHGTLTLVVPPERAYGNKGLPPKIPPGATMIYTIRVVDIKKR